MSGYDYAAFSEAVYQRTIERGGMHKSWHGCPCFVCWKAHEIFPDARTANIAQSMCPLISGRGVDSHHLVPKQVLKRELPRGVVRFDGEWVAPERMEAFVTVTGRDNYRRRSLDELLMDPRNGVLVARHHHDALEQRQIAIPKALWPTDALEFAEEIGMGWWVDKMTDEARRA